MYCMCINLNIIGTKKKNIYIYIFDINEHKRKFLERLRDPSTLSGKRLAQIIQAELCTAGQLRRSLFMGMWLCSSFNKWTTWEILSSRYVPERGASFRFACSRVILRCDTPPRHLCMQRCHFNEGLKILPVSCKFPLTWRLPRHKILFWSFMSWNSGIHGILYGESHSFNLL